MEAGSAKGSGVQIGDPVVKIAKQLMELEEMAAVDIECLGYDATIEVIGRLLPKQDRNVMVLTLKCLCKSNPFLGNKKILTLYPKAILKTTEDEQQVNNAFDITLQYKPPLAFFGKSLGGPKGSQ
jgi:hypothetical protein